MSDHTDEYDEYDEYSLALDNTDLVGGPGLVLRDTATGQRERPAAGEALKRLPRHLRLAELVCKRTPQRPTLVTVVLGTWAAVESAIIRTGRGQMSSLGEDILAPCRCGHDHAVIGSAVRSELIARRYTARSGRVERIDIAVVSNDRE